MSPSSSALRATEEPRSMLFLTTVASTMAFLLPFARHFREQGWRIDGCASGLDRHERAAGAFDDVYDLPLTRSIRDVPAIVEGLQALDSVLRNRYDIVHVHTPIAAFLARVLVRRMPRGRPMVVYTAHGFHFHQGGHPLTNFVFRTAEQVAGRWTDRLVVINEEDRDAALRYHIVPGSRLCYMHGIGVDTGWYAREALAEGAVRDALERIGMDPGQPYFVTVGELSKRKRPEDVVRALAGMRDRRPGLVLLGDGPREAAVRDAIAAEGLGDRVFLPGNVSDVRPFIAGALALVQASSREGLPRSMMEALALEVPLVATTARGQPELVGDDRGWIVEIGAIREMAEAMDRIAADPEASAAMGRNGRRVILERYGLGSIIAEHERLYAELLDEQ